MWVRHGRARRQTILFRSAVVLRDAVGCSQGCGRTAVANESAVLVAGSAAGGDSYRGVANLMVRQRRTRASSQTDGTPSPHVSHNVVQSMAVPVRVCTCAIGQQLHVRCAVREDAG